MRSILTLVLCCIVTVLRAQTDTIDHPYGIIFDSTTFTFSNGDSLNHRLVSNGFLFFSTDTGLISIDTSSATLWQTGSTIKTAFLNDSVATNGIMTDTVNPYPPNANDFFVLKMSNPTNFIIDIWHKYQMDSLHAGGIVEFSTDSGASWMNVAYCNQINFQNYYSAQDTIISGQPAFTGNSNGEQLSRIQFMNCELVIVRETSTECLSRFSNYAPIYLRFRFVSDSTVDSLAGWMIDSIQIENPGCLVLPGAVSKVTDEHAISVFPNPANDILNIQSSAIPITQISITNILGQTIDCKLSNLNTEHVEADASVLSPGVYFIKINNNMVKRFVKEAY